MTTSEMLRVLSDLCAAPSPSGDLWTVQELVSASRLNVRTIRRMLHEAKRLHRLEIQPKAVERLDGFEARVPGYRVLAEPKGPSA
jgi:hypothetical protein